MGRYDRPLDDLLTGLFVRKCRFESCYFGATLEVRNRVTVRDVTLVDCRIRRVQVGPVVLDDITIDGLHASDPLFVRGAALRHVTLRGKIPELAFRSLVAPDRATNTQQAAFDRANAGSTAVSTGRSTSARPS